MNIFLEGNPFAGKTTLLKALGAFNDMLTIIDEHDVYAGGIDNYPAFPSRTKKDAEDNVDFFYRLEQQRHLDALRATTSVFDRSIFSVIIFQKYIDSLQLEGYSSAYKYAKAEALRLIDRGLITVPDAVICVNADYRTIAERHGREISVGLLRGKAAHDFLREQYAIIESVYAHYGLLQIVSSANGGRAKKQQVRAVNHQINTWSHKYGEKDLSAADIAREVIKAV